MYDPRDIMNTDSRTHNEVTAIQQTFRDLAAPTIEPGLHCWPLFRRQVCLVGAKDRQTLGIHQVEADAEARVARALSTRQKFEFHIRVVVTIEIATWLTL